MTSELDGASMTRQAKRGEAGRGVRLGWLGQGLSVVERGGREVEAGFDEGLL
jgi:hypothetical protein